MDKIDYVIRKLLVLMLGMLYTININAEISEFTTWDDVAAFVGQSKDFRGKSKWATTTVSLVSESNKMYLYIEDKRFSPIYTRHLTPEAAHIAIVDGATTIEMTLHLGNANDNRPYLCFETLKGRNLYLDYISVPQYREAYQKSGTWDYAWVYYEPIIQNGQAMILTHNYDYKGDSSKPNPAKYYYVEGNQGRMYERNATRKYHITENNCIYSLSDVEQSPEFRGGESMLMKWLSQNVHYPEEAYQKDVQGRVVVSFIVEKNGYLSDIHIERGVDTDLDNEAIRVVKSMPVWKSAKKGGKPVRCRFALPITFKIQDH